MTASNELINTRQLSEEEKLKFYLAWESSGLSKNQFCKEQRLPVDTLHYWHKKYKKREANEAEFSRVTVKSHSIETSFESAVDLGFKLPNGIQFQAMLSTNQIVTLIRGLCDATSTVW